MAYADWGQDFKTWVEKENRWTRPLGIDWTLDAMARHGYARQQDWWTDPRSYQWQDDTSRELVDWRENVGIWAAAPTLRQEEALALLGEWAQSADYTGDGGTDVSQILPGTPNPADPSEIWVLPIDLYGFAGGYYKVGEKVFMDDVAYEVGEDGVLRRIEEEYGATDVEAVDIPTFEEFLASLEEHGFTWDLEGTDAYQDWQSLTDLIAAGGPEGESALGWEEAYLGGAKLRGFETPGEYIGWLQEQQEMTQWDMAGLGPEITAARERMIRTQAREQEELMERAFSRLIANRGIIGDLLRIGDQHGQQISDARIKATSELLWDQFSAQEDQFTRQQEMYAQERGELDESYDDFMKRMADGRAIALGEYSKQLDVLINQNMQYLQMYSGEFDALMGEWGMAYQIANLAMSLTDQDLEIAQQAWDQFMESEAWQQMLAELPTEGEEALDSFLQIIGMVLGFAGTIIPG